MARLKMFRVIKDRNIGHIPRRQCAYMLKSVTFRGIKRRQRNQLFRRITLRHTDFQRIVNAALPDQIICMTVIRA